MKTGGEEQLVPQEFEHLGPKFASKPGVAIAHDAFRDSPQLDDVADEEACRFFSHALGWGSDEGPVLRKTSTTTRMDPSSPTFGKAAMKFIEDSHGWLDMGKGSRSPSDSWC